MEQGGLEPKAREELEVGEIGFSNLKRLGCLKSKMLGFLNLKMDGQLETEAEEDMPGLSKLKVEAGDERLSLLARKKTSAWKSSPKTEKRLRLDWTKTAQDRKFLGLLKTATTVQSSVSHDFRNLKTDKRPV